MVKPRTAITESPVFNKLSKPDFWNNSLSEMLPPYNFETNEIHVAPVGVVHTNAIRVLWCLYEEKGSWCACGIDGDWKFCCTYDIQCAIAVRIIMVGHWQFSRSKGHVPGHFCCSSDQNVWTIPLIAAYLMRAYVSPQLRALWPCHMDKAMQDRINKNFGIYYVMSKECSAIAKYPALHELEVRHGVGLGQCYKTKNSASIFSYYIDEGSIKNSWKLSRLAAFIAFWWMVPLLEEM